MSLLTRERSDRAHGFISLLGVAVMSGVLVIAEINRKRDEPGLTLEQAVIQGSQMRPVLMMVVAALLGMLPAARATGIGSVPARLLMQRTGGPMRPA